MWSAKLFHRRLTACLPVLLLVLTSVKVQALDLRTHLNSWYSNTVLNRESVSQEEHHVAKLLQAHSEFYWLPKEKLLDMSLTPYSRAGRTYEAVKDHILPVSVLFIGAGISEAEGWLDMYKGRTLQNLLLRVGSTLGDMVTAESSKDLAWRFAVSNLDVLRHYQGKGQDNALYFFRRILAYAPYLYRTLPEVLWELGVVKAGKVNIKIEPAHLQERIALSMASASLSETDDAEPPFAYIDWKVMPDRSDGVFQSSTQNTYEQALLSLDKACRHYGVSGIRFYGAVENGAVAGVEQLSLYLKLFFHHGAAKLVKFPAHFGSGNSAKWWTLALDSRTLQGVYNNLDQYRIVKAWNHMRGYGLPLVNPLNEAIISSVPELIEAVATGSHFDTGTARWRGMDWLYTKADIELRAENKLNLVDESLPHQSSLHTLISNGEKGALFIDDSRSRRVTWPEITLLSHAVFSDISASTLVDLESHLPWSPVQGGGKIAKQIATDYGYSLLTRAVISVDPHEHESPSLRKAKAARATLSVLTNALGAMHDIVDNIKR